MEEMVQVRFAPQVWINGYAVGADPEGETTFMVERSVLEGISPDSNESDNLIRHPNAPEWIRDYSGPFYFDWDDWD